MEYRCLGYIGFVIDVRTFWHNYKLKLFKVYREISKEEPSKRPINFMPEGFWLKVCQTQIKDKLISFLRCLVCPFKKISTTSILKKFPRLCVLMNWHKTFIERLRNFLSYSHVVTISVLCFVYWFHVNVYLCYFQTSVKICLFILDKNKFSFVNIL